MGNFAENIAGGAHLHSALAGGNGGIAQPLNVTLGNDNRSGVFSTLSDQALMHLRIGGPDNLGSQVRSIFCTGFTDSNCGNRNTAGHLHSGKQGVEAIE